MVLVDDAEYMMDVEMMARLTLMEESTKDRLIGENRAEIFLDDFQFFRKCGNCKARIVSRYTAACKREDAR